MKIRNKLTGQIFEVVAGTLYPSFFEEVTDDDIKIGEPKVEFEIEETKEEDSAVKEDLITEKPQPKKKTKKPAKKGAKKNGNTK